VASPGFGLLLGGAISSFFLIFYPQLLISVESFVSIFAAYTVGKEIWRDLDAFLQDRTQSWRVRWVQQSFYYVLQQFGTFQRFWQLARRKRYGYQLTLPNEIDMISHSNSKTIEMLFKQQSFEKIPFQLMRVLRIVFESTAPVLEFPLKGLIICRVAVIRKRFGIKNVTEYYQAYDQGKIGSLDLENTWHPGMCLEKRMIILGRLVCYTQSARLTKKQIIDGSMLLSTNDRS
jgi:hypothetical protein